MNAPAGGDDAGRTGSLILVPNTLDLGTREALPLDRLLAIGVIEQAAALSVWAVENAKSARAFLKRVAAVVPLARPLQELTLMELPAPPKGARGASGGTADEVTRLLAPLHEGRDVGLLSEAGMPAVADPGSALVAAAHAQGLRVVPLVGPCSIVLAVAASGLNGQNFAFVGYVPSDAAARTARLRELEALSRRTGQAQWMIETPYRNAAMFSALLQALTPGTRVSVSCGLTLDGGWSRTLSVQRWRAERLEFAPDRPALFGLQAG